MKKTLITIIICICTLALISCDNLKGKVEKKSEPDKEVVNVEEEKTKVPEKKANQKEIKEEQVVEEPQISEEDNIEKAKQVIINKTDINLDECELDYVEHDSKAGVILINNYGKDYHIFFIQYIVGDGSYVTAEKCYAVKKGTEDVYVITPIGIYTYKEFNEMYKLQ